LRTWPRSIRSCGKVHEFTQRAISAATTDDKLNAIARAFYELADFVDDLENKLNSIDQKLR
jgi:hypothetical protein